MQFQFSFKQMESSDALESYAETKLKEKITKFVTKHVETHVTFSVDKHRHIARCRLKAGDGFNLEVQHACGDMYGSVDKMLDKLEIQLKRQKSRVKQHKGRKYQDKSLSNVYPLEANNHSESIDAEDILKYEEARRKIAN